MDELTNRELFDSECHEFKCYDWDNSPGWQERLKGKLVPLIREYYTGFESLKSSLRESGIEEDQINRFLDNALKATIPSDETDKRPDNFKVRRADFAEILAALCLEGLYNTKIPAPNIPFRELTLSPGRGMDILGYETANDVISLILCEIKGSNEPKSPPQVVDKEDDCLKNQLYAYTSDKRKTLNRILNAHKKASSYHKEILAKIALWWSQDNIDPLKVIVCPFLVRQADCYSSDDFGSFRIKKDEFLPASIRYLIICIHGNLIELSKSIYAEAGKLNA